MELISKGTKIDFFKIFPVAITISLVALAASIFIWFEKGDAKYGIDYVGGHRFVLALETDPDLAKMQQSFDQANLEATVQAFEIGSKDLSVRLTAPVELRGQPQEATQVRALLDGALKSSLSSADGTPLYKIVQTDFIGPTVGQELREKALLAVILGLVAVLIYISVRFEFAFAIGAIVALFHDVIISTGVYLWAGYQLNGAALAAVLSIIGYSVNDTIVIFDKVREEIFKRGTFNLKELLNDANNAMLSRTIITSSLTLISALALYLIGGGAIAELSLFLVVGVISGSLSTIFIACPIVLLWDNYRRKKVPAVA